MNHQDLQDKQKTRPRLFLWSILAVGLVILAGIAGVIAFSIVRQITLASYQTTSPTKQFSSVGEPTTVYPAESTQQPSNPASPVMQPTLAPWDGIGRVTVLLLGLDYRDWDAGSDYSRSDTMILLTLDPLSRSAGILSVPRDLWVAIPGFKHGKINTAYYLGDAYKLPGGGPGLAVDTVEQFLGVPINYYAQIDFGAFVRFIDEIE
jgi:anionic cell wall polymer biosynthesis LytR-Cps2A-Psr (LCP) family protein